MGYKEVLQKCRKTGKLSHDDFKVLEIENINLESKLGKARELLSKHLHYWEMIKKVDNDPNPIKALAFVINQMELVKHEKDVIDLLEENNIN